VKCKVFSRVALDMYTPYMQANAKSFAEGYFSSHSGSGPIYYL